MLLEVDADREWLATQEERVRLATAVNGEIEHLQREIRAAEQGAIEDTARAASRGLAEASQRLAAAEAAAQLAQDKLRRINQLEKGGLVSATDAENARADEQGRTGRARRGARGHRASSRRADGGRTRPPRPDCVAARASGRASKACATRRRRASRSANTEAERRRIRAPVSGRLGEVTSVQIGAVVREASIWRRSCRDGQVRAVAEFAAPALGRMRPGSGLGAARWFSVDTVRTTSKPTVTSVASETREQRVRVELAVQPRR